MKQEHKVTEVKSFPYFNTDCFHVCSVDICRCLRKCNKPWLVDVRSYYHGISDKDTISFETKKDAYQVKIGYLYKK